MRTYPFGSHLAHLCPLLTNPGPVGVDANDNRACCCFLAASACCLFLAGKM